MRIASHIAAPISGESSNNVPSQKTSDFHEALAAASTTSNTSARFEENSTDKERGSNALTLKRPGPPQTAASSLGISKTTIASTIQKKAATATPRPAEEVNSRTDISSKSGGQAGTQSVEPQTPGLERSAMDGTSSLPVTPQLLATAPVTMQGSPDETTQVSALDGSECGGAGNGAGGMGLRADANDEDSPMCSSADTLSSSDISAQADLPGSNALPLLSRKAALAATSSISTRLADSREGVDGALGSADSHSRSKLGGGREETSATSTGVLQPSRVSAVGSPLNLVNLNDATTQKNPGTSPLSLPPNTSLGETTTTTGVTQQPAFSSAGNQPVEAHTKSQDDFSTGVSTSDGGYPTTTSPVKLPDNQVTAVDEEIQPLVNPDISLSQQETQARQVQGPEDSPSPSLLTNVSTAGHAEASVSTVMSDVGGGPVVNSAHLIQSMNHSEMRLGMQSSEFGNISISTSIGHQSLSAQISIEHSELGRALAVHLPAIEQKLGTAYGLPARVELHGSGSPTSAESGPQSQGNRRGQGNAKATGVTTTSVQPGVLLSSAEPITATSRLDIRI